MESRIFELEVEPRLPHRFARLAELANDLYYSWDRDVRRLFRVLDNECWEACANNPKLFLRRVPQVKLEAAARDLVFIENYNRVLSAYDTYTGEKILFPEETIRDAKTGLIAYFCAEYGFHESFPIYSGGLGILAADYCKVMSDLRVRFVAVGLLYRQGYFSQRVGANGEQLTDYPAVGPSDLPVSPALDGNGDEIRVALELPGRRVELRVWQARAGHVDLYLLDSDLPVNSDIDRTITHKLYGGDAHMRIEQEIVLGIGGVRVLRALGLAPTVWHANEGHAGFTILERCRELVSEGLDFEAALEAVAAGTVFTSHTPVSAGHDVYHVDSMRTYFGGFCEALGIDHGRLLALGADPSHPHGFNMTSLALRGSRFVNGVSQINGRVAAEMNRYAWPEVPPEENPFGYVTNGIHIPSFLGPAWVALFDMYFGRGWRSKLCDKDFWAEHIERIPDHVYLSTHQVLKAEMLLYVRRRFIRALRREGFTEPQIRRMTRLLDPERTGVLTIGFARRFATYKRATLLFRDLERLERVLGDPERPVVFLFAGKAHPKDEPGKELLRQIFQLSLRPELEGKIIVLEDYNLSMARSLLPGVDVWLNTPRYPMEACGTSGMKAGINGVINLSVLDGWWAEAYDGENGWAIMPHHSKLEAATYDAQDATELLDILEYEVLPLHFENGSHGDSEGWIRKSRASMKTILPRFNANRMALDYIQRLYRSADEHSGRMTANGCAAAHELARWKRKVAEHWAQVRMHVVETPPQRIRYGESMPFELDVDLDGLGPEDVVVECVLGGRDELGTFTPETHVPLRATGEVHGGSTRFRVDLSTTDEGLSLAGQKLYKVRMYPHHRLLSHRFECGLMRWL